MRLICLTFAVLLSMLGEARANTVVVMNGSERAGELNAALEVALASRGVRVASLPPPWGQLRLDRAAAAQRAAVDASAQAALWIDVAPDAVEVCVVSADGRHFRHAPIAPSDSARVFAAIATSLLDELLAPPEGPLSIDVNVSVSVNGGPAVAVAPPGAPAPVVAVIPPGGPGIVAPFVPVAPISLGRPVRSDDVLFEIGPMASPLTLGIESAILFPVSTSWKLGAMAGVNYLVFEDAAELLFVGAVEARRIGRGMRHFDVGFLAGGATAMGDPVGMFGVRLNWVWERQNRGTALTVAPVLLFTGTSDTVFPGVWASVRWGIPI